MAKDSIQNELSPAEIAKRISLGIDELSTVREKFPRGGFRSLDTLQLQTLLAIMKLEQARPRQIADELNVDKSAVTEPLQVLKGKRLISIKRDPSDARGRVVSPRKAGRDLAKKWAIERGAD